MHQRCKWQMPFATIGLRMFVNLKQLVAIPKALLSQLPASRAPSMLLRLQSALARSFHRLQGSLSPAIPSSRSSSMSGLNIKSKAKPNRPQVSNSTQALLD